MPDKKLTDSEIIEDLKLWIDLSKRTDTPPFITYLFLQQILDLINRLQAENEQLTKDKENLVYSFANAVGQKMTAKAEAYKECIEKVKKEILPMLPFNFGAIDRAFDNLLKELVGDSNG